MTDPGRDPMDEQLGFDLGLDRGPTEGAPPAATPEPAGPAPSHPRELVRASAGTGKTFRISSRIIGLLAADEPPRSILASTFTRKAAGEILERVLVRLARAALDPALAAELAAHAVADPDRRSSCDPAFWRDALHRTVRELHRFDVGTLDAFFIRAARTFGHELGLPPRWGIADEPVADRIKAEALQEVLSRLDDGARVELVRGLAGGRVRRSVHDALLSELDAILAAHRGLGDDGPGWDALRDTAALCPDDLPDRCRELADRLAAADVPLTQKGTPHSGWQKGLTVCVDGLRERSWPELLKGGLFQNALDDPEKGYYSHPIDPDLVELLCQAALLARHDLARDYAQRAAAMGRLAALYADVYDERLRDAGALRFDDVTRMLTGPNPVGGRDDLFYRLDGHTRHLLLDEFQDTSLMQWTALEPLTDELLGHADPGAAVIVADPKQSIYGWRGAAPAVVEHVGGRYDLAAETLDVSYRSSQVVLDAVNRIFRDLPDRRVFEDNDLDRAIAADWARAFAPHQAAHDLPGHVRVEAGPRDPGQGAARPLLMEHVADRVAALHRAAPGRGIGVLTRRNATVARLILELRRRGVDASEEGGTALIDSAAVASVLALLRLADHPGDALARYHVARTPVGPAVGEALGEPGRLTDPRDWPGAERVAAKLRRRLVDDGYGPTLGWIAELLAPACDDRERARLRQLAGLGRRYQPSARGGDTAGAQTLSLRVDDFVRLAEATRVESPGTGAVRVMTVHQAKGLEFDTVVLPELDGPMTGTGFDYRPMTRRVGGIGPVTHAFPYVSDANRRVFDELPELHEAYEQTRAAQVRDALSVLYVGITRARHALHIVVAADGDNGRSREKSHARIVREALAPETLEKGERIADGQLLFGDGDPDWHRKVEAAAAGAAPATGPTARPAPTPTPDAIPLRTGARTRGFERRSPSGLEGGPVVDLRRVLGIGTQRAALDRGTVVHAWLEAVAWIDDGIPDDDRLRAIARRAAPRAAPADIDDWARTLRDQLRAPELRAALSRDRYPADATIEAELPFLRRDGDALMEGFIDRLVLVREEGRVVRAEILDFKTDTVDPDGPAGLAARARHYAPQLQAYRQAVSEMYGLALDDVAASLVFLTAGRVVAVDTRSEAVHA